MLHALIFDIGNVLLHFDFEVAYQRMAGQCDRFNAANVAEVERLKVLCESGIISGQDFVAASMDILGFRGTTENFTTIWQEIFTVNEPMVDFVKSVQGRYPLYLLSNTSQIHVDYFTRTYPLFSSFQGSIYSHQALMAKPDPAIFELAVTKFGVDPEQTAYIDDLLANIKSARAAGFRGLHYDVRGHDIFLGEMSALLEK